MSPPLRNRVFEKIDSHGSLTDVELTKMLIKDEMNVSPAILEKILLDLEILGLISVSILAKGTRRIEVVQKPEEEEDAVQEHDYEASFPGADS